MKFFLLFILLFLYCSFVFSQERINNEQLDRVKVINIETAVKMAISENLLLRAQQHSLSARRRSYDTRFNALMPTATLSSTFARPNEILIPTPGRWDVSWQLNTQLVLSASIFNGIELLAQDYELGRINYADFKSRLKRDVRKLFFSLLVMEESIKVMESTIELAERSFMQADINFRYGLVSELDRLQAQVTLESLRPDFVEMVNTYQNSMLLFKEILGLGIEDNIALEGVLDPEVYELDIDDLVLAYLSSRFDVRRLEQLIKISNTDLSASRNSRIPSLILGYSKNMMFVENPFGDNIMATDSWRDTGRFFITLSLDVMSFLPFMPRSTEIRNKRERIKEYEIELSSAIRRAEIEIRTIAMNMEKSINKIRSLELNERLALRTYELASQGYNAGTVELLSLERAMNQLLEARVRILQEKFNYQAALLDFEYAINRSLEGI
ncbi:MAG: TolC family protein [Spirochaetaceae bacterium]|nr:TolC family protein [Spirochaetaceae bacterium]